MTEESTNGSRNGWRISKDIPVSVVAFLAVQTGIAVWFMSGQATTLSGLVASNVVEKATRYSKEDASREREFQEQKYLLLQTKTDELVRRISVLEGQTTELLNRLRATPLPTR